ncbi:hypothetical protein CRG98_025449 [Punica granatum]|uniref:Uncharacterized protein n=1 Tax=Punica granatum TaxID=22663 RepID=A0A2I0JD22_PUNGR|nr:hypothetical protein CRG98_025449 [Punica granatum]
MQDSFRKTTTTTTSGGVPWLSKAIDLASKFHREPPWRRPTRLVPVGSVQYSSRVCSVPFGSVQRKTAQTRPVNGPTRLLKVPSRISGLGQDTEDLSRSLPGRSTGSLAFSGFLHNPGRFRELVDTGYRPRWLAL